ncbi:MAG: DoxX family protein [Candidatus Nanohaloarchaea archaeon]|nr:DoxX family protein [Candidatus Nanohaloarchaea archaeon]
MCLEFIRSTVDDYDCKQAPTYVLLGTRLLIGWIFFYSGISKLVENGLAYGYASTWLKEATPIASPTIETGLPGLLQAPIAAVVKLGAVVIEPVFQSLTSLSFIGSLVVIFEIGIGIGLLFGVATRLFSLFGAGMMMMFYYGNAEWSHGLVNGNLVYMFLFVFAAVAGAGRIAGVDAWLEQQNIVQEHPPLRYLLG